VQSALLKLTEPELSSPEIDSPPVEARAANTMPAKPKIDRVWIWRWLALHQRELRGLVVGAVSLALFLLCWHLLTKYRVTMHVRFVNVPSPEMVFDSLLRSARDNRFLSHVYLSCRRVFIGFLIAAIIAVPLGLVMGRFRLVREFVFPVSEVLRPIPAIAWVPMSIMLWPSNEESIVFITFLGSFFPILLNTLHGMVMVDPCLFARRSVSARARLRSFARCIFPRPCPTCSPGSP
jgi:NitT/TauT family transport system permease protein